MIDFARGHVGREVVIRVDLQAFFSSVFAARVIGIFRTAGYPEEVSRKLAALCTHRTPSDVLATAPDRDLDALARLRTPHLPQGAPTSGALANLAAYRLDVRVAAFAAKLGAHYSRYADDLVISGPRGLARAAPMVVGRLAAIAADEGSSLAIRKTRVMTASGRQRITGVVVNEKIGGGVAALLATRGGHEDTPDAREVSETRAADAGVAAAVVHAVTPDAGAAIDAGTIAETAPLDAAPAPPKDKKPPRKKKPKKHPGGDEGSDVDLFGSRK